MNLKFINNINIPFFSYKFKYYKKIFPYNDNSSLNKILNKIRKNLTEKYPKKWKGRKLYPHLFRPSRLTELATGTLNEA